MSILNNEITEFTSLENKIRFLKGSLGDNDYIITTNPNNIKYLVGLDVSMGMLIVSKESTIISVDGRYPKIQTVKDMIFSNKKDIPTMSGHTILVDADVKYFDIVWLRNNKKIDEDQAVIPSSIILDMRSRKSQEEIDHITEAGRICKKVVKYLNRFLKEDKNIHGRSERDLSRLIKKLVFHYGGDAVPFDPIVAYGANAAVPHHFSTDEVYNNNHEVILCDFGASYRGYSVDMARVFRCSSRCSIVEGFIRSVKHKCSEAISSNVKMADIAKISKKCMEDTKIKFEQVHSLGHGIGMDVHEMPSINEKSESIVKDGVVFTLEPGMYFEGSFGVRVEDTYMYYKNILSNLTEC
ncbi:MAG: M24 family metallopeptidase [Chlamydiia bacterium]|nr:M24 family metallopeptidase [Chlamydiia bacterium]